MNGTHNLDVGLIVAPVLTEFLAAVAKSYEIDFKYTTLDPVEQKNKKEQQKVQMMLKAAIDRGIETSGEDDRGVALLKEMSTALEEQGDTEQVQDEIDVPPEPVELQAVKEKGLMARRGM